MAVSYKKLWKLLIDKDMKKKESQFSKKSSLKCRKKYRILTKMVKNRYFSWSEWRDLNSRPLDPQSSALPTALHPDTRLTS